MVHVQRPTTHGEKFNTRWFPSSGFDTRGPKDLVMYHPKYKGPKVADLINEPNWRSINKEDKFQPPEGEECIEAYSEKKTPKKEERKKTSRSKHMDSNPFDVDKMRPYHENADSSTTKKSYTPENNAKWGKLQPEPQSSINKWQQGFMSIE